MSDLVERLRKLTGDVPPRGHVVLAEEAADRIEQLEAALRDIQVQAVGVKPPRHSWYYDRAAEALSNLCEDEGCPNAGTPHVCINRVQSSSASCSGCAGITHTHTCGDPAKQPQLDSSPPARQENDDVYPGFRGNNEA
jgi:hypothetical protein